MDTNPWNELTLDRICQSFVIKVGDILDLFLMGSRLWGSHSSSSDYDLYIVLKDNSTFAGPDSYTIKGFSSIHSGSLDAFVISNRLYQERLANCEIFDLITLWVPESYSLKSQQQSALRTAWKFHASLLLKSIDAVSTRDLSMAQKHANNGNMDKSKKVLIHTIRMMLMAEQIAANGEIEDWKCADDFYHQIRYSYHCKDWISLSIEVQPVIDVIKNRLVSLLS